ncbi:hypothetical protein [Pseudooceanicola marinus]|nr:hypothetical protein [Pseudooceanicola marinus]MCA1336438.1 hypothetical protein [Pseudooceanicola marinus]
MRAQTKRWMKSVIETAKTAQVSLPYNRATRGTRAAELRSDTDKARGVA